MGFNSAFKGLITLLDNSQSVKKNMRQMKEENRKKRRLSLENTLTGCICQGRSPLSLQGMDILPSYFHCNLLCPEVRCCTFLSKFELEYTASHSIR